MRHVEALPVDYCQLNDEQVDALFYLMELYQKYSVDLVRLREDARKFRVRLMELTDTMPDG